MVVELKKGYIIDSYYDRNTRSYITTLRDKEGNQIRNAYYSGNMTDRNSDVQHLKEFFYEYMNEALDLKKSIKDTKEKTKKSKLPALSTLSPIMPDVAAGIDTFNSGVGLSEDWVPREELEDKLRKLGFKYKFNKYSDKQLYKIYQERLKYLEKKKQAKEKKKQQDDEVENKRVNSKDSFIKNGIEFESEDAAREYFGESMDNKFYLNDMHKAWDMNESYNYDLYDLLCSEYSSLYPYDITLDQVYDEIMAKYNDEDLANDVIENLDSYEEENFYESKGNKYKKALNENLKVKRNSVKHNFKTITEGLKYFERKEFNENYRDAELESLYEGVKNNLDQEDIKKLGNFLKKADSADDVATFIKGLLSEDMDYDTSEDSDSDGDSYNTHYMPPEDEWDAYFSSDYYEDGDDYLSEDIDNSFDIKEYYNLANDILSYVSNNSNIWQCDLYDVDKFGNNVEIKFYVKGDWKHDHWHFDVMLKDYLKENYPDISYETWNEDIDSDDEYDSDYYPGIHVLFIHLDRSNQEDNDEPLELKLVDDESINESIDDSVVIGLYGGDETFYYPEDFYSFINKCKKAGLAVSNETYDDLGNWELTLTGNGNTIYKLSRDLPGYFNSDLSPNEWIDEYRIDESLNEAFEGNIEDINIDEIVPQQKDYDRAKGLQFRGKTFKGSGEPFSSEASKMAKLIKDPIKLIRRAKAVAATYGADEGYMSNNGWYHYVAPDKESDVWGPFKKRLVEFGFTRDQINSIKNFKPLKESLNEDINRYSDIVPYENRKYWYFTTHGVGPGTIPKDLHILEIREGQNDRGTWGDFVCLDGVLNTSELQKYDLRELAPSDV